MDWSKFTLKDGDHVRAMPCLDVVAFSNEPPAKSGPGFERFFRTFTGKYQASFRHYRTGDMKKPRKFQAPALDGPLSWFKDGKLMSKNLLSFLAYSGSAEKTVAPPALEVTLMGCWNPASFCFRSSLDVSEADAPDDVVALARDALADFPLHSGYCGYSFIWNEVDDNAEAATYEWSNPLYLRYPGFNNGDVGQFNNAIPGGLVAVSWLTFLGKGLVEQLGGLAKLDKALPSGASLIALPPGGCIVRTGPQPELGDVNRRDKLPSYRAVGKVLAPCRASDDALENFYIDEMDEGKAHDWKLRFFK
jgi:hypothetical protein